jgi:hypothetical protein
MARVQADIPRLDWQKMKAGNTKPEFFWFNVEQGRVADTRD